MSTNDVLTLCLLIVAVVDLVYKIARKQPPLAKRKSGNFQVHTENKLTASCANRKPSFWYLLYNESSLASRELLFYPYKLKTTKSSHKKIPRGGARRISARPDLKRADLKCADKENCQDGNKGTPPFRRYINTDGMIVTQDFPS